MKKKRLEIRVASELYKKLKGYQADHPHLSMNAAVNELLLLALADNRI